MYRANIWKWALQNKPLQNVAVEVKNKNFEGVRKEQ